MKRALLAVIGFYRAHISPHLPPACRFYPNCSVYAMTAIRRFGAFRGLLLAVWRVFRCNPWCRPGLDYVPVRREGESFFSVLGRVRRHEGTREDPERPERVPC